MLDKPFVHLDEFSDKLLLKGITREKQHLPQQALAITVDMLLDINRVINHDDPKQCTIWCLFLFAFFLMARKSNLVPDSKMSFDIDKQLTRNKVILEGNIAIVIFNWSKTIQMGNRILKIPLIENTRSALCPLRAYRNMCKLIPAAGDSPAFLFPSKHKLVPVTYTDFQQYIKEFISGWNKIDADTIPDIVIKAAKDKLDSENILFNTTTVVKAEEQQKECQFFIFYKWDWTTTIREFHCSQFDSEGRERVCAYNGRSLSQSESKWSISEKECLAVLEGIKNYHVYLANSHFKIYTDHQALKWLSSIKQSTGRLARWSVLLQGYDYEICFRRGSKNTNANCLSRREYPHTDNNLPEPEDSIPSIEVNHISTSEPNNSDHIEVTFFFTENPPIQRPLLAAIDTPTEFNITTEKIGDCQKDCSDFKDMYTYLSNDILPEDKNMQTRQGQGFASKLVAAINQIYNVKHSFTSSYHPQTNSVAERTYKTIIQCMRTLVDENQLNWPELLPGILMAFRMTPSASLEFSPFYLVFGKEMNLPLDTSLIPKPDINKNLVHHINNVLDNMKIARTLATENLKHAQEYQKLHYDKNTEKPTFEIQDQVLMYTPKVPVGLSSKLHRKFDGPFYIARKGLNHTYKLRRCSNNKELKSMINANRLKLYHPPDHRRDLGAPDDDVPRQDPMRIVPPNFVQPQQNDPQIDQNPHVNDQDNTIADADVPNDPIQDIDQNKTYEISRIIKSRKNQGKPEFLIKWAGYTEKTWEPEEHIPTEIVRQFYATRTQKGTRRRRQSKIHSFSSHLRLLHM
ncbi:unnamed protein product [Mytilus edulis]|uniref:Uncharacterized protein n=1 Tax=Mytilus edulis TaxID=6550 RepID=A0A8S3PYH8_MYTED|nr:unnamed protein product [Mytilus edulis]